VAQQLTGERIRFVLVGAWNTLAGYAIFVALHEAFADDVGYLGVLLLAHVLSVLVAFAGYRYVVFKVRGNVLRDLMRFWSVYALVLALNVVVLPLLVEVGGLPAVPAQGLFVFVSALASYVGHKKFSFAR
jgi:putative flippase GtrA